MTRKCTIENCPSKSSNPQHRGVTYHTFPSDSNVRKIWLTNCRINTEKNITKNVVVCSRHFRSVDFQRSKSNKFLLKQGTVPTIFPWNKIEKNEQITENSDENIENSNKMEIDDKLFPESELNFQTPVKRSYENDVDEPDSTCKMPRLYFEDSPSKSSTNEDLQQSSLSSKSITALNTPEIVSHQRKIEASSPGYTQGAKIEAQDFNGTWHTAKVVEVDSDEREVLIRFEKSRKSKGGGGGVEEWIPMNSSRLRHIVSQSMKKPPPIFEIGEKCMARWTGARKFPATVTKVYGNDTYEVIFEDGIEKTTKGHHMSKIKQKTTIPPKSPTTTPVKPKSPKKDWPLISMSSLNLEELNLPEIPKDGEWCCHWVNDQPIGQEGFLMVGDHKKPTVIVEDWRLPPKWIKHMYQRSNVLGKWDVILVSPQGKRFRSKADLKQYLEELGQCYNPDVYDFSIHRRRAKDIGAYVYTKDYKPPPPPISSSQQYFAKLQNSSAGNITLPTISSPLSSPSTSEPSLPLLQKEISDNTPVQSMKKDEPVLEDGYVYIGSLKVQIIDNLFRCPEENCNKNFRKENHLQIHIKHYHCELAKHLGVCPNMQDLACKRTIGTVSEEPLPKNHLPNVQFFAKLHQQDIANKTHRKSITSTTPASTPPLISNQDGIQSCTDSNKKDNLQVFTSTESIEIKQQEITEPQIKSPTFTQTNKSIPSSPPPFLTTETPNKSTANIISPVPQKQEVKLTAKKSKKVANKKSASGSNRRSSRQKLTKKFVQSHITSSLSTSNGGIGSNSGIVGNTVSGAANNNNLTDMSFGVSDQEETRHSFSGGNSSIETKPIIRKSTNKPEPLFIASDPNNLDATSQSQTTGSIQESSQSPKYINENGEIIKIVRMRQEEIINCLCSYCEEDGLMIQCELCLCWQHGLCNGIEKESQVPEKYICYICRNPQRGRASLKYIHDQDWMYEGKLPVASYHAVSPDLEERFEILRKTHVLTGNLLELKKFMHSLKVKINIAENKDHPKMYLWTNKWESSPTKDAKTENCNGKSLLNNDDIKNDEEDNNDKKSSKNDNDNNLQNIEEDKKIKCERNDSIGIIKKPTIPQPEAPIDPVECQRRLLEHIKNQQSYVIDRLQTIESQIMEIESLDDPEFLDDPDDYSKTKETIAMYIKDLETMKNIAKINTVQVQPNFAAY